MRNTLISLSRIVYRFVCVRTVNYTQLVLEAGLFIYIRVFVFSDKDCDFRIQLPNVSRQHAKLEVDSRGKVRTIDLTVSLLSLMVCYVLQVFVQSLADGYPILLDNKSVTKKTFIPPNCVMSIGSCNFRFAYYDGVLSPRKEQSTPRATPVKSPKTPASGGKENKATPITKSQSPGKRTPKVRRATQCNGFFVITTGCTFCRNLPRHPLLVIHLLSLQSQEKP